VRPIYKTAVCSAHGWHGHHGVRIIRLPGHRFRAELSEEVRPVRDAAGQIDIQGTMQAVTSVIKGWIREYPDQWLWLHRRWR